MSQSTDDRKDEILYVGFWARMLAFLIDNIAASILIAPLIIFLLGEINVQDFDLQDPEQLSALLNKMAIQFSLDALFLGTIFIAFWAIKSATPGKMMIGCCIVDAESLGKTSNYQNVIRYLAYFISLLPFGLGFIWIAFDKRKQGWHDKISKTVVIKGAPLANGKATPAGSKE
ncbi:MAG: RDD family protein [Pseudomonadales bacterium]|jgi:uncharacterized RDD family membrane protein YckC